MDIVTNRRQKLRLLIDNSYNGSLKAFVEQVGGVSPNELSGLLRKKAFGERKARLLEKLAGLPPMYLDTPLGDTKHIHEVLTIMRTLPVPDQELVLAFCQMAAKKKISKAQPENGEGDCDRDSLCAIESTHAIPPLGERRRRPRRASFKVNVTTLDRRTLKGRRQADETERNDLQIQLFTGDDNENDFPGAAYRGHDSRKH